MDDKHNKTGKREISKTAGEANLYALVFLIPLLLIIVAPYYYFWPEQFSKESFTAYVRARETLTFVDKTLGVAIIIAGAVVHELLHGLAWSYYARKGWKSIRFGIVWKYLTPYCHCREPLKLGAYRIGSILPSIVLGFVPSILAVLTGNLWLLVFGFIFTFAAGGDFLILWLLRMERSSAWIQDHPHKIGCIVMQQQ